jgi:hypothetical protein
VKQGHALFYAGNLEMVKTIDHTLPTVVFSEEKSGRFKVGYIALNNPRALNALDLGMLRVMESRLLEWWENEDLACVVLYAKSEKAFCAGGDVKSLVMALEEKEPSSRPEIILPRSTSSIISSTSIPNLFFVGLTALPWVAA